MAGSPLKLAAILGVSAGLTTFDETALGVVLPTLESVFDASATQAKWVVTGYLVVMAGLVAACGRLADFVSPLTLWRAGLGIFLITSIGAGAAPSIDALIAVRLVQGIGAAFVFTMAVVLVGQLFPAERRGEAFGVLYSCTTVLLLAGPVVSGILTHIVGWRWVFWITVPPALWSLFALPASAVPKKDTRSPPGGSGFDLTGAITLMTSVAALSVVLMQGDAWGWTSPAVLGCAVLGITAGIAFVARELSARTPLVDLRALAIPTVAVSIALVFMAQYRRMTTSIYIALYLRKVLDLNPLMAGLALVPSFALLPLSTVVIGRLADRLEARGVVIAGAAVLALAVAGMAVATATKDYFILFGPLLLAGAVAPAMFGPPRKAMLGVLPEHQHAQMSGLSLTAQIVGGAAAISVGNVLLVSTGATWPIFAVLAAMLFVITVVAVFAFERQRPG